MITIQPQIRVAIDHDGGVILDIRRDRILTLNRTGSFIWSALLDGQEIATIAESLSSDEVPAEAIEADIKDFIADLKDVGIIEGT